jgi:TonB-dependent receptor
VELKQEGTLSFIIFKDFKPLAKQEAVIYLKKEGALLKVQTILSDEDGYAMTKLEAGEYQLQVVAKEGKIPLVFARKNFTIVAQYESQIILALDSKNEVVLDDAEVPQITQKSLETAVEKKVENGFVQVTLLSSEDQKPIKDARIFVKGLEIDVVSDEKGNAVIEVPATKLTFLVVHHAYSSQSVEIDVMAKETLSKTIELSPASMELEEFVVLAPKIEGSIATMMAEEKKSDSITSVIGSEQMSKQGDSNAASALKRVAGVTLIGGKYVYVRGLGDRYSSTELNSLPLPSPNPIKRTVPLDMFPSGVIGSMEVQKSFSPDITGAFGGGYVNIRTKQGSDDDYIKISLGAESHTSTGKEAASYKGSSSDWSGYDSDYRALDSELLAQITPVVGEPKPSISSISDEQMQEYITQREYNKETIKVPYGTSMNIETSKNFTIADEHEVSILANYGYKSSSEAREYTDYDYVISSDGVQTPTPDNTSVNNLYKNEIQHGGMFNLAYKFRNIDAKYTKLYVLNTLDQTRDIVGTFGENNSDEHQTYLEWQERELDVNQFAFGADYDFFFENRFDIGFEFATASEYVPNDVYYDYRKLSETSPYTFVRNQSSMTFSNRTTDDELYSHYLKNKAMTPFFSDEDYVEVGIALEEKERIGRVNTIRVQSKISDSEIAASPIDTILTYEDPSKLDYDLISQPKDNYDASLNKKALYLKSMIKPLEDFYITFGARKESVVQEADQFDIEDNVVVTKNNKLDFDKLLPSLGLKYSINEQNQIKFSYAKTFVYPDFREFIDSEFIHPEFVAKIAGNPDLVETDIESYDIQYGYYFDDVDNITVSLFYKDMINPIEDVRTFTTSTLDRFSFENSSAAEMSGFEFSWYKNLDFLSSYLKKIVFSGNYTYVDSAVTLTEEQKIKYVTQERQLQGLSPEVLNLSLTYQDDGRSLNLSYNKMSERLMRVALKNGDVILGLDDYEIPPELLDFTWIEKFDSEILDSELSLAFKIKNILDSETIWKQGDLVTLKYKTGQSYSLSVSAKF